jgi:hypothetical protein
MKLRGLARVAVFVPANEVATVEAFARQLRIAAGVTLKKDIE